MAFDIEKFKKFFNFRKPNIALEGEGAPNAAHVPEDAAVKCEKCRAIAPKSALSDALYICPKCGFHMKVGARERILFTADPDTFEELDAELGSVNRLEFPGYDEKLEKARQHSGENEGVVTGVCCVGGYKIGIFAMDYRFMMGSMGAVVGEKITRLFEHATAYRLPVVGFILSGGARMQEGIVSLMQMAKTAAAVGRHSDEGLLYISVLTNPTTGGVSASFAFESDMILAEPGALIGFAGPRVIEQTIRQKLPEGFQSAEFVLNKGFIDAIVDRRKMRETLASILALHEEGV